MEQFSERIAFARKRMNLSQSQLASILGVSRGACGQWEQAVSTPSVAHLSELARVTDVSFEWLATGRGAINASKTGEDTAELTQLAGRQITGDLRELVVWLQKLPTHKRTSVIKLLRNLRSLIEE
jgi:transcriptional regulator with XRE-family HTH domain